MPSRLRELAEGYIGAVVKNDAAAVADLFSENVQYINGEADRILRSPKEIESMYTHLFKTFGGQDRRLGYYLEEGDECAFELETSAKGAENFAVVAIDRLTLGSDGKIERFLACFLAGLGDLKRFETNK